MPPEVRVSYFSRVSDFTGSFSPPRPPRKEAATLSEALTRSGERGSVECAALAETGQCPQRPRRTDAAKSAVER